MVVVGVFDAIVFFEAVVAGKVVARPFGYFVEKDVVGGGEGEGLAKAGSAVLDFLNTSDFVVNVIKEAASLISVLNQVAMSIWLRIFQVNQSSLEGPCYQPCSHEVEHRFQPKASQYGQSISMMHSLHPSG